MMLHMASHSLWSLLLSFAYRYFVLLNHAHSSRSVILAIAVIYIPSLIQLLCWADSWGPPSELAKIIHKRFPAYDLTNQTITGSKNMFKPASLYVMLHLSLPVTPAYVAILILRKKILDTLDKSAHYTRINTQIVHRQLLKSLTIQACLPGLYWFAVAAYAIGQIGIYNHPGLEYTTFSLSICWTASSGSPIELAEIIHKRFAAYDLTNKTITGSRNMFEPSSLYVMLHLTLPVTPAYVVILILRKKITVLQCSLFRNLTNNPMATPGIVDAIDRFLVIFGFHTMRLSLISFLYITPPILGFFIGLYNTVIPCNVIHDDFLCPVLIRTPWIYDIMNFFQWFCVAFAVTISFLCWLKIKLHVHSTTTTSKPTIELAIQKALIVIQDFTMAFVWIIYITFIPSIRIGFFELFGVTLHPPTVPPSRVAWSSASI
ncbi:unnamed protein product [Caenorhabditis auriculariae]|uniref:G protein-coupled receptor n=1 Tax=Caenorhabditis auriculariae TaxID=2777116 RepID=A0A8S1HX93_9PELO|nr:unnamed protein product [Caenorhabditis auriculariae]